MDGSYLAYIFDTLINVVVALFALAIVAAFGAGFLLAWWVL